MEARRHGQCLPVPAAQPLPAARSRPSVTVASAGALGLTGRPIEGLMADHLVALGLETVGFTAAG